MLSNRRFTDHAIVFLFVKQRTLLVFLRHRTTDVSRTCRPSLVDYQDCNLSPFIQHKILINFVLITKLARIRTAY